MIDFIKSWKLDSDSYRNGRWIPIAIGMGVGSWKMEALSLIFIFLLPFYNFASNLSVSVNADTILIGDIYTLEMSVENIGNSRVFFPEFKDTIGNSKIEIVESYPEDTLENKISKKWDLSIYYPGTFQVAGFSAIVQNKNGSIDTLKSFDPMTIYVKTIAVDTSKAFKPIKASKSIPYPFKAVAKKWAPYIIGLAILVAILLFLWYKYKNKDKPKYVRPKTALDYHKEAITKLKELEKQKLWQSGRIKEYYLNISEILREYLEGRFGLNAMESTTDEIIYEFKKFDEYKSLSPKLKEILQQCDLAKFAKFKPLGDENMRMMKMSQNFVSHTKPKPVVEENNNLNEKNTSKNG